MNISPLAIWKNLKIISSYLLIAVIAKTSITVNVIGGIKIKLYIVVFREW